ncbi:hypothetical protein ACQP2F_23010 [Actinoplanes sp. CA-030573]|uniref:hypothetical protein n=1 Tax=Actinoplanes sp. CA-030573 TaxID=3239898 RepID=UPI003D91F13E
MDGSASDETPTGGIPHISDYWPDAPHRMGPEADYYPGEGGGEPPPRAAAPPPARVFGPPAAPRRTRLRFLLGALAALVFLGGSVVTLGRLVLRGDDGTAAPAPPAPIPTGTIGAVPPSPPVSIAPEGPASSSTATEAPAAKDPATTSPARPRDPEPPFSSGTFEMVSDVAELDVTIASLGADPVRVSAPAGSGLTPRLSRDGSTVRLSVRSAGEGTGKLAVRLNRKVTWSLRMTGGVRDADFALSTGMIRRIDLIGGAGRWDMALPVPDETLPIRMTGGVGTWTITTPREVPVKVLVRDGAGSVTLNGDRTRGIDRNTTLQDGDGEGGLDIDAVAGLGSLTVGPAGGTG